MDSNAACLVEGCSETPAPDMCDNGMVEAQKISANKQDFEDTLSLLEDMEVSLKASGVTFDELMKIGREERKKMFAELYPDLL